MAWILWLTTNGMRKTTVIFFDKLQTSIHLVLNKRGRAETGPFYLPACRCQPWLVKWKVQNSPSLTFILQKPMLALGKNFLCNVLFIKNSTLDICGSMIWRKVIETLDLTENQIYAAVNVSLLYHTLLTLAAVT